MPKAGFLTPKAIGNRQKAKGLQKLRWYCQMCSKQCRDANGFKCHLTAESHLRMMKIFRENRGSIMDEFSTTFKKNFMALLRRRWRTKRVRANKVYQTHISFKEHVHLNATQWTTMSNFIRHLGEEGLVTVEETEKGLYITYIDRDPDVIARQEAIASKERSDLSEAKREQRLLEAQIKLATERGDVGPSPVEATELKRTEDDAPLKLTLATKTANPNLGKFNAFAAATKKEGSPSTKSDSDREKEEDSKKRSRSPSPRRDRERRDRDREGGRDRERERERRRDSRERDRDGERRRDYRDRDRDRDRSRRRSRSPPSKRRKVEQGGASRGSAMDDIFGNIKAKHDKEREERRKEEEEEERRLAEVKKVEAEKKLTLPYWLMPTIIVKVMNKELADGKYYKLKGEVKKVIGKYVGVVKLADTGTSIKIDQEQLETVIPAIGSDIAIVNGKYRGTIGTLKSVDFDNFSVTVDMDGVVVEKPYEAVCKVAAV